MTAADDLARVAEARPRVLGLARVVSLAAHVDVALVRALRIALLADVSTEADLWSSPLVRSRGRGELVLRHDVRSALWDELRGKPAMLDDAWRALSAARRDGRPLLLLEERLTFHALRGDLAAIDRELRTVIAAMRDAPDRRRDLAAWSAQALAQLPEEVCATDAAHILGSVARAWVATPRRIAEMTPPMDSLALVQSLQPDTGARVSVHVRRIGDTLEVGTQSVPPCVEIPDLPAGNPMLILDHDRAYRLDLRGVTRIPVRGARIMVGTLDRRRWWLEPEQDLPNPRTISHFQYKEQLRVTYLVTDDCTITSARWLVGVHAERIQFDGRGASIDILAIDEDTDIGLLRLHRPASDPPLELAPDVKQGQSWQAFPPSGGRILGTVATAWPDLAIRLPADVTLPPGTPIFTGAKVIGHVKGDPRDGLVHLSPARQIQCLLDQMATRHPGSPVASSGGDHGAGDSPEGGTREESRRPVVIELPERISTTGLLGAVFEHDGGVRRIRRRRWGAHDVTLVTDPYSSPPPGDPAIRVRITESEIDPQTVRMEFTVRLFRNRHTDAFYTACSAPPTGFQAEVLHDAGRGRTSGTYDLELIVNRIPGLPPGHAYRRGVQFVTAALDAMDHPGEPRNVDVLHIPGCGALDLVDAQQRLRAAGIHDQVVTWIDPETDLVERCCTPTADPSYSRIAKALGGEVAALFGGPPAVSDLLTHRFGVARQRGGRQIAMTADPIARISVRATSGAPVCGYVSFYWTTDDSRIEGTRVRAADGVASCELPRRERGYTVGAVIEDEGLPLEAFVSREIESSSPPSASAGASAAPPVMSGSSGVFVSGCRQDRDAVHAIADALRSAGLNVFLDERDLGPHIDPDHPTREALERSAVFLAVVSRATDPRAGDRFWFEWRLAIDHAQTRPSGAVFIVPVALDKLDPERANVPEEFRRLQWYEMLGREPTQAFLAFVQELVARHASALRDRMDSMRSL